MTTPNTDLAEQIRDAVAGALLAGEACQCTRVWEAWMYKTMTDEDFVDASDGPLPEEVAAAVLPIVDAAVKRGQAEALRDAADEFDSSVGVVDLGDALRSHGTPWTNAAVEAAHENSGAPMDWLRARADLIEKETPDEQ